MPSSATITAFYNFTANTKARASQVNNNFDVFRGHIIPVSTTTATSDNNTWDLGSNNYQWKDLHINRIYKYQSGDATTTASQNGFARSSSTLSQPATTTTLPISNSTLTISSCNGIIELGFYGGKFGFSYQTASGITLSRMTYTILKNNATLTSFSLVDPGTNPYNANDTPGFISSSFKFYDYLNNTTATYHVEGNTNPSRSFTIGNIIGYFYAKEII
jgi:hypothetical protein